MALETTSKPRPPAAVPALAEDRAARPATTPTVELATQGKVRRERPGEKIADAPGLGFEANYDVLKDTRIEGT